MFDTCFGVRSFQSNTLCRIVFWHQKSVYEVVAPRTFVYWDICGNFLA